MTMYKCEEITQIQIPLPFALKIINAYLIKGGNGYTIVDTGLNTKDTLSTWKSFQAAENWTFADVEKIVITHYHPDHYGFSGSIQQDSNAPVYISRKDFEQAQLFFKEDSNLPELMASFFLQHGLDDDLSNQIPAHLKSYSNWVNPHPVPTYISADTSIVMGDRKYMTYHTPGHADGHLSFYDSTRKWLIGGDFLLPKITPNISLWPACEQNPLKLYLETLEKMSSLEVTKVFPSHGPVFENYLERIDQIKNHHDTRLFKMREVLTKSDGLTAYQICLSHFGNNLGMHNLRFALSETIAHLEYLRLDNIIKRSEEGKYIYYV